jgi:hypothetical protein
MKKHLKGELIKIKEELPMLRKKTQKLELQFIIKIHIETVKNVLCNGDKRENYKKENDRFGE